MVQHIICSLSTIVTAPTGFIGGVGGGGGGGGGEGFTGKCPLLTIINRHFKMGDRGAKFVKMCTKLFFFLTKIS